MSAEHIGRVASANSPTYPELYPGFSGFSCFYPTHFHRPFYVSYTAAVPRSVSILDTSAEGTLPLCTKRTHSYVPHATLRLSACYNVACTM
ncbi:hypothetical protein PISMIDRAFT_681481 [Pisolithus microcarpus 441]|uniref:Uncharacterized protein n=1 Tax=Pisolithus microcarpus 441 TaxID=765257 RepID=A0A0C9ZFL9_9AGAM|nr:hypothetical protein PISMIDRAFT_681481 [Pisolithus microcarpus 441]